MAEAEDEKASETLKNQINDEFKQIHQLLNEREKKLLGVIDNNDNVVNVVFDTEALHKLINVFGAVDIDHEEKAADNGMVALESTIITDKAEVAKLTKVLLGKLNVKTAENMKLKLLYSSTRDDDTKEEFHKKCDEIGATLTIVHTEFNAVFGCFTSIPWSSTASKYNADDTAFIFLLRSCFGHETPKTYTIENDKYKAKAVYHNLNYGPAFGHGQDIGVDPSGNSWIKSGYSFMFNGNALCGGKEFEDLNRKKRYFFKYTCYEVFGVE